MCYMYSPLISRVIWLSASHDERAIIGSQNDVASGSNASANSKRLRLVNQYALPTNFFKPHGLFKHARMVAYILHVRRE